MGSRAFFSILYFFLGKELYDLTQNYLDEGGPKNSDRAKAVLPYAKAVLQVLIFLRILLFALAIKWRGATRFDFFIGQLIYITESFMPIDVNSMEFYLQSKMIGSYMDFWLSYFYWWPSLGCSIFALVPLHINRYIFHGDPIGEVAMFFAGTVFWHGLNLLFIHLMISKVGILYAETEVLRGGNE